jgi:Fe(3+) dicitrate transport protein
MRNTTGNRDRQFEVAGIEPRIHFNYIFGDFKNELEGE